MDEDAVAEAVRRHLARELGARDLLLTEADLAAAEADVAAEGARLVRAMLERMYPQTRDDPPIEVAFDSDATAERVAAALVFGAETAMLLSPSPPPDDVVVLCAIFNLGIGLIDGLGDGDRASGLALLDLVDRLDLAAAAGGPRGRGWLRAAAPAAILRDAAAAFAIDIVETFFALLHDAYGADTDAQLRRNVGSLLQRALDAERRSIDRAVDEQALDASRLTSVLPFTVIETLVHGAERSGDTAGTHVGEAMWRIDDLVDLCDDASSGALNALLVADGDPARAAASGAVARAAAEAADALARGLARAGGERRNVLFFVQRYAGIGGSAASIVSSNSSSSTGRSTSGGM